MSYNSEAVLLAMCVRGVRRTAHMRKHWWRIWLFYRRAHGGIAAWLGGAQLYRIIIIKHNHLIYKGGGIFQMPYVSHGGSKISKAQRPSK